MGGIIPLFDSKANNDLSEKKSLNLMHRITKERADGSKEIFEKTMDFTQDEFRSGDQWLTNSKPCSDKDENHFRQLQSSLVVREKHVLEDKEGNRIIDEKALRTDDQFSMHGTKMIRSDLNIRSDKRLILMDKFSSKSDLFKMLGNSKSKQLFNSTDSPLLIGD